MTADTQALVKLARQCGAAIAEYQYTENIREVAFTPEQLETFAAALQGRQEGEPSDAVTRAGSELSNIAFNLSFRNPGQFTARDIVALDEARKKWDAAINAGRAALAQAQKEQQP